MEALLSYAIGEEDSFEILEQENQTSNDWYEVPAIAALQEVEASWRGREQLIVNLLRNKDRNLAFNLLESLSSGQGIRESWDTECSIPDIEWWIE